MSLVLLMIKKSKQNQENGHNGSETQGFTYKLLQNTLGSTDYVRIFSPCLRTILAWDWLVHLRPIMRCTSRTQSPRIGDRISKLPKSYWSSGCNIHVPLDSKKPTMSAMGSCYWFRTKALKPLFAYGWKYEDFLPEGQMGADGSISHAIERANGYVAQSQGFYPAWVLSDKYARIEVNSLLYTTNSLLTAMGNRRDGETLLATCQALRGNSVEDEYSV